MFLAPSNTLFTTTEFGGATQRVRRYCEPTDGEYYYIRTDIPYYQDLVPDCPACGANLHHSSGWERRICDTCGFVEGAFDYRTYPVPYSLSEYIYLLGLIYQMMQSGALDKMDGNAWMGNITVYGSMYRPVNESE